MLPSRDDILDTPTPTPQPIPGDMVPLLFRNEWHMIMFVLLAIIGFCNVVSGIIDIIFEITKIIWSIN